MQLFKFIMFSIPMICLAVTGGVYVTIVGILSNWSKYYFILGVLWIIIDFSMIILNKMKEYKI